MVAQDLCCKQETGLLSAEEAGRPAAGPGSDADAPRPAALRLPRIGRRALAATGAFLLGAALASAGAALVLGHGGREHVATAATGLATRLYNGAYGGYSATVVHRSYEPEPQQVTVVHHHYEPQPRVAVVHHYAAEPVRRDVHFATEVHHDAMPVYHGDAYHGSYHQAASTYPSYSTYGSSYGYHSHYYAVHHGSAGIWWIILFAILVVLAIIGIYYYLCRK